MINTILFDLDGTLLRFKQDEFIEAYFNRLAGVFLKLGLDPECSIKAVWAGTGAMVKNDGRKLNIERFWETFKKVSNISEDRLRDVEAACDAFYINDFNSVKSIVDHCDIPKFIVRKMKDKGYTVILATNPLFPECGVISRLGWGDIDTNTFSLITHYANSSFCKPNLDYYREILEKTGKKPEQCLMIGNNPAEDMIAQALGMQVFLVTDYMENDSGIDITKIRHGSLSDMETFLLSMPDIV